MHDVELLERIITREIECIVLQGDTETPFVSRAFVKEYYYTQIVREAFAPLRVPMTHHGLVGLSSEILRISGEIRDLLRTDAGVSITDYTILRQSQPRIQVNGFDVSVLYCLLQAPEQQDYFSGSQVFDSPKTGYWEVSSIVLLWLAQQQMLPELLKEYAKSPLTYDTRYDRVLYPNMVNQCISVALRAALLIAFHDVILDMDATIPWEWQRPITALKVVEYIGNNGLLGTVFECYVSGRGAIKTQHMIYST